MKFILISQRAKGNPDYKLNNLPGHGRFDIIMRVILAATRQNTGVHLESEIYCYLKGSEPYGWIRIGQGDIDASMHDEISLAGLLNSNWTEYWTDGCLEDLLSMHFSPNNSEDPYMWYELSESGSNIDVILEATDQDFSTSVVILGAQQDISEGDRLAFSNFNLIPVSLGSTPLLASQTVSLLKSKIIIKNYTNPTTKDA